MKYEFKFLYFRTAKTVQDELDKGWEPVPHVRGFVKGESGYLWLRRDRNYHLVAR